MKTRNHFRALSFSGLGDEMKNTERKVQVCDATYVEQRLKCSSPKEKNPKAFDFGIDNINSFSV